MYMPCSRQMHTLTHTMANSNARSQPLLRNAYGTYSCCCLPCCSCSCSSSALLAAALMARVARTVATAPTPAGAHTVGCGYEGEGSGMQWMPPCSLPALYPPRASWHSN